MSKSGIRRYDVRRTDGSLGPRQEHEHCSYFVLNLACDPNAIAALKAYVRACRRESPELQFDRERYARRVCGGCQ